MAYYLGSAAISGPCPPPLPFPWSTRRDEAEGTLCAALLESVNEKAPDGVDLLFLLDLDSEGMLVSCMIMIRVDGAGPVVPLYKWWSDRTNARRYVACGQRVCGIQRQSLSLCFCVVYEICDDIINAVCLSILCAAKVGG